MANPTVEGSITQRPAWTQRVLQFVDPRTPQDFLTTSLIFLVYLRFTTLPPIATPTLAHDIIRSRACDIAAECTLRGTAVVANDQLVNGAMFPLFLSIVGVFGQYQQFLPFLVDVFYATACALIAVSAKPVWKQSYGLWSGLITLISIRALADFPRLSNTVLVALPWMIAVCTVCLTASARSWTTSIVVALCASVITATELQFTPALVVLLPVTIALSDRSIRSVIAMMVTFPIVWIVTSMGAIHLNAAWVLSHKLRYLVPALVGIVLAPLLRTILASRTNSQRIWLTTVLITLGSPIACTLYALFVGDRPTLAMWLLCLPLVGLLINALVNRTVATHQNRHAVAAIVVVLVLLGGGRWYAKRQNNTSHVWSFNDAAAIAQHLSQRGWTGAQIFQQFHHPDPRLRETVVALTANHNVTQQHHNQQIILSRMDTPRAELLSENWTKVALSDGTSAVFREAPLVVSMDRVQVCAQSIDVPAPEQCKYIKYSVDTIYDVHGRFLDTTLTSTFVQLHPLVANIPGRTVRVRWTFPTTIPAGQRWHFSLVNMDDDVHFASTVGVQTDRALPSRTFFATGPAQGSVTVEQQVSIRSTGIDRMPSIRTIPVEEDAPWGQPSSWNERLQ